MSDELLNIIIKAQDMASGVMRQVGGSMDSLKRKAGALASDGFNKITNAGKMMTTGLMIGLPILGGLVAGIAVKAGQAQAQVQTMGVALETAMGGNIEATKEAQKNIIDFATKTPFALGEVQTAFVKLKNMGLDPSNRALTSYGDTASAMGKSLNDMVEAVADAATGEFERLKEFGIRSESQGNKVKFTFKGVTTEVGKNSKEIEDYLIKLGETNFAGGMEKQSKTLSGLFSTLSDTVNLKLASAFDKLGGTSAVTTLFAGLITNIENFDVDSVIIGLGKFKDMMEKLIKPFEGIVEYIDGSLAILFKGELKEGIFGIEDIYVVYQLFAFRDSIIATMELIQGVAGILFFGEIKEGIFGIEDIALVYKLFELREQIINAMATFSESIDKVEAFKAVLLGVAVVITTVLAVAMWGLASAVIAATWPFVALGAVVAALYYAWTTDFMGMQTKIMEFWAIAKPILDGLWATFNQQLRPEIEQFARNYWPLLKKAFEDSKPVLDVLANVIGVVLVTGFKYLATSVDATVTSLGTLMRFVNDNYDTMKGFLDMLGNIPNDARSKLESFGIKLPSFATGTNFAPGGMKLVGENGPELMVSGGGEKIYTNSQTRSMLGGGSGLSIGNITIGSYMGTERDKRNMVEDMADAIETVLRQRKLI